MQFTHDIYYPVAHRTQDEIDALKNRYKTLDETIIPAVMKSNGFTSVSWTKPTTWGTSHVIYIVTVKELKEALILRANIGWGEREGMMIVEKCISDRLMPLGTPVNQILVADISRKQFAFDYQIQKKLQGVDIEDYFHGAEDEYDALSFAIGKYVGLWSYLSFTDFGRFDTDRATKGELVGTKKSMYAYIIVRLDDDIRFLVDSGVLDIVQADTIQKLFDQYKDTINAGGVSTLVHHDLADHNIMFDGKRTITGFFDWEAAVAGDPILDLASSPTWKTHFPREEKMIEGYKSVRDLPEYFKEKMDIYRLRTMLWKMVYAVRAGILNEDRKNKFQSSLTPFKLKI